jgi:hypothetical protein
MLNICNRHDAFLCWSSEAAPPSGQKAIAHRVSTLAVELWVNQTTQPCGSIPVRNAKN